MNLRYPDPPIDPFHHIVQREAGAAHGHQRLHLHAGRPAGFGHGGDYRPVRFRQLDRHIQVVQRNLVAEWDPLVRSFPRLDGGDPGHGQRVSFFEAVFPEKPERLLTEQHLSPGRGPPAGRLLFTHVHHFRLSTFIGMGQSGHFHFPVLAPVQRLE